MIYKKGGKMGFSDMVFMLQQGILQVFKLCIPILGAALIIGLIVAIFQATTSIQEQTLTFLPKLLAILLMLALMGSWMISSMQSYATELFNMISKIS